MAIKKLKNITFTINPNQLALNQRKFTTGEIGRGIGIHKVSKGKGSFTRKEKHKKKPQGNIETSFYVFLSYSCFCHAKSNDNRVGLMPRDFILILFVFARNRKYTGHLTDDID